MTFIEYLFYTLNENQSLLVSIGLMFLCLWSAVKLYPYIKELINDLREEKEK